MWISASFLLALGLLQCTASELPPAPQNEKNIGKDYIDRHVVVMILDVAISNLESYAAEKGLYQYHASKLQPELQNEINSGKDCIERSIVEVVLGNVISYLDLYAAGKDPFQNKVHLGTESAADGRKKMNEKRKGKKTAKKGKSSKKRLFTEIAEIVDNAIGIEKKETTTTAKPA